MKIMFMHTIDDMPAEYIPGEQICFARKRKPLTLAQSKEQIFQERKLSRQWRWKVLGCGDVGGGYGWVRVAIP